MQAGCLHRRRGCLDDEGFLPHGELQRELWWGLGAARRGSQYDGRRHGMQSAHAGSQLTGGNRTRGGVQTGTAHADALTGDRETKERREGLREKVGRVVAARAEPRIPHLVAGLRQAARPATRHQAARTAPQLAVKPCATLGHGR